jgi:hypothetical protein
MDNDNQDLDAIGSSNEQESNGQLESTYKDWELESETPGAELDETVFDDMGIKPGSPELNWILEQGGNTAAEPLIRIHKYKSILANCGYLWGWIITLIEFWALATSWKPKPVSARPKRWVIIWSTGIVPARMSSSAVW